MSWLWAVKGISLVSPLIILASLLTSLAGWNATTLITPNVPKLFCGVPKLLRILEIVCGWLSSVLKTFLRRIPTLPDGAISVVYDSASALSVVRFQRSAIERSADNLDSWIALLFLSSISSEDSPNTSLSASILCRVNFNLSFSRKLILCAL